MTKLQFFIISLMFCIGTIDSAVTTGYFYDNPIRPFNPTSFSPARPRGQYSSIPYGQKVESNTQTRLTIPPIPTLPPLTTYIPKQTTKYDSSAFGSVPSSTPTSYNTRTVQQQQQRQQQVQSFQQQQQQPTQTTQFQRQPQQEKFQFQQQPTQTTLFQPQQFQQQTPQPYSYPKPQVPLSTQFTRVQQQQQQQQSYTPTQQRINIPPQSTNRPPTQFYPSTTPTINIPRQTPKPTPQLTVVPQQEVLTASVLDIPTASVINIESNPIQTSAGLLASPDIYVVDGRQLKQYKVYEHIDNDIDQEVHNFLPANFFLNTYHSMIGDTHPLGEEVQVQNRASSFQQRSQQISQPAPNTVALGSGGLGFVKLPNGSVYLGSGSLGYISSLQHSQDVQDLRSRTSLSGPDALHFGHGSLSDSFYYRNQKD